MNSKVTGSGAAAADDDVKNKENNVFKDGIGVQGLRFKVVKFDPWDMLNNFCFHVYAQKSLFIGENSNDFFWTSSSSASPDPVTLEFIELVPS